MGILDSPEKAKRILDQLDGRRRAELENEDKRIDILMAKKKQQIVLAEDNKLKVILDPGVDPAVTEYLRQREKGTNRIVIRISPGIFLPKDVTFLGERFQVFYVLGDRNPPGISVNRSGHKIFINPFNQEVSEYSVSFVEICVATEVAYTLAKTKDEMRDFLLRLLGTKLTKEYQVPAMYLFSLRDELQRRQWAK